MTDILVDSNVILDVVTEDPQWFEWSAQMLTNYAEQGNLVINPIIYAEISIGFNQPEEVEAALPEDFFCRDSLPYAAAFLAGQSFLEYPRRGGERRSPLPDFYIGAHAAVTAMPLLTRDVNRYRTYFPSVLLITP
ncbi:type II toxin-antitoxin system VapC family toxin [Microcystis flos-aquae FACHB-1344]|uniref:Type II toxin-antitoxin system VapC family toxin n=1 Tax=Microcystis flos-aquae FACHB-1344 TaxID=2692899 RepID=A0ABR8HRW3_9CHRO|nr:type II toxin-antitoxin system VapC family toxin [Microcystis flos-aquae]MBD2621660.1 type II toxin-antitoxin system VapC family toxin [Microcystis flos-aquae FACHB-1344]